MNFIKKSVSSAQLIAPTRIRLSWPGKTSASFFQTGNSFANSAFCAGVAKLSGEEKQKLAVERIAARAAKANGRPDQDVCALIDASIAAAQRSADALVRIVALLPAGAVASQGQPTKGPVRQRKE